MATREEMLRKLMGDKVARPAARPDMAKSRVEKGTLAPVGTDPNAIVQDDWTRRRGQEIEASRYRYAATAAERERREADAADMFAACFNARPEPSKSPADAFKAAFVKALLESGDHRGTRTQTMANDAASEVAARAILGSYEQAVERGRKPGAAAERAADDASDAVDAFNEARLAFGRMAGRHDGDDKGADGEDALRLFEKIRGNPSLMRIVELAGKLRRFGASKQKRKTQHGSQDLVGIGLGGLEEVSRLVPSEAMNLVVPTLRADTLRRIAEGQAMVKKLTNTEPVAKGPVIGCFDESGSMSGPRNEQCKALGLTLAWIARQQGRWCCLVGFASHSQRRVLVLPPGKWSDDAIVGWLTGFFCGGTVPPVDDMPGLFKAIGAAQGKTDIIYVTDGEVFLDYSSIKAFNAWRQDPKVKARVTTLLIGAGAGGMEAISDETHLVSKIDVDQEGVGAALSF